MTGQRQIVAKATALIILSACTFGSLSTLTVLIGREGMPLLPAMFWRYLLAALVLLIFLRRRVLEGVRRHDVLRLMAVGGLGQALITYLSLYALEFLPVGPLAFLFYTYPAWVVLISAVFGREDLTLLRIAALSIAMTGIVVMVGMPSGAHLDTVGVILALGTALLYAIYLPSLNYVQRGIPAGVSSFYLICGVLVVFLVANISMGKLQMPATTEMWGYLAALSLFSTVIAFAALIAGLRVLGPVRTSIVATIEPFFTALLGAIRLDQALTPSIFAGGMLIAGAVLLLQITTKDSPAEAVSL
jgi:drug/metabolite transporter (DMT)-like permease